MEAILEKILSASNMRAAYSRVKTNKGVGGIDGVQIEDFHDYVVNNWKEIREQIISRSYQPQPVMRVEIPKESGGMRKLGIPTLIDRMIQQAIVQVLSPIFEETFQEYSYGFRPCRSCEQAILRLCGYLNEGKEWIVDIDLEKFFDNVPQDRLMSYVGRELHSPDVESLIRKYLQAGIMNRGQYEESRVGTPQGGNLSPLLSNIMLNELDKELQNRGLSYVRYADDCVIAVSSKTSANRVMRTITDWIERKLGLKVNAEKTHVCRPMKLKYLGFSFIKSEDKWQPRPHIKSVEKFKRTLKKLCKRKTSISMSVRISRLNAVIRGWINYFSIGKMKTVIGRIDEHLRTMLRVVIWKQWKVPQQRAWGLRKLGISEDMARLTSYCGNRYQWIVTKTCVVRAISKEKLQQKGLVSCLEYYQLRHSLKSV